MAKITKIKEIEKFGIFNNFDWNNNPDLNNFNKYNLIFGKNGTGKTTLSRIFSSLENQELFDNGEDNKFIVSTDTGNINSDYLENNLHIRVFNKDFINENFADITSEPKTPSIIILGKTNKESKEKLDRLKVEEQKLLAVINEQNKDFEEKNKKIADIKRLMGKSIVKWSKFVEKGIYNRLYNAGRIKEFEKKNDLTKLNKLDEQTIESYEKFFKDSSKFKNISDFNFICKKEELYNETKAIFLKEISGNPISFLKENGDIEQWIKHGLSLHNEKKSGKCFYCNNQISDDRIEELKNHFNDEYSNFLLEINNLKTKINNEITNLKYFNFENELPEFTEIFKTYKEKIENLNNNYKAWLEKLLKELENKEKALYSSLDLNIDNLDFESDYRNIILDLNKSLVEHRKNITQIDDKILLYCKALEEHYIADGIENYDYLSVKEDNENLNKEIGNNTEIAKKMREDIIVLENESSDIGEGLKKLNETIQNFLGRGDIELSLNSEDNKTYFLLRNGRKATFLSEGEQTAISFSYFLTKLDEPNFDKKNGIVYIDDPISSLDSNFLHCCFAFIKEYFKGLDDFGQLFISTHNFEFFELLKTWGVGKNNNKIKAGGTSRFNFYLINAKKLGNNERVSEITNLPSVLEKYKGEYQYLFHKLKKFDENPDNNIYEICNTARRFLEGYMHFKIPCKLEKDFKSRLSILLKIPLRDGLISSVEFETLFDTLNYYSHYNNIQKIHLPNLPEEVKNTIKMTLKVVEITDEVHYNSLIRISKG